MLVNVGTCYLALELLPPGWVVAGLGAAFGLGNVAGAALAWLLLSRRLHGLSGRAIGRSLLRMHAAAVPAAVLALALTVGIGDLLAPGRLAAFVTAAVAGSCALLAYLVLAWIFRVREVTGLAGAIRARLGR